MAGVGFEEFSAPPGSELALPPLFGGNILESELETEVEFVDGGLSGDALPEDEEEEALQRQRELGRRKVQALGRRCREIEQVRPGPSWGISRPTKHHLGSMPKTSCFPGLAPGSRVLAAPHRVMAEKRG